MSRRPQFRAGRRAGLRAGIVSAVLAYFTVAVSALVASPAFAALHRDDGDDPGPGMSKLKVLGVYVGIPVAAFVLIWVVVSIPSMIRGPRYRPGKDWEATPEWYGAPGSEHEQPEVESGYGDPAIEGRPTDPALSGTIVEPADGGTESAGGGTSARW
ncbi:MAG TPA: hypothetical protein VMZ00_14830 [Sporichthya sp.]|nr:hypothetical protein [Sporichthya sp.]